MGLKTGFYEVLSSDEASTVYGGYDGIATAHTKLGWLKNLKTHAVSKVSLVNLSMPLVPGEKIAIAFFNGEIIAFKRSREIPVETPFKKVSMINELISAVFASLLYSIPVLGYIGGIVLGGIHLVNGENLLGRYKRMRGNRAYSGFLLLASLVPWAPPMYRRWGDQMVINYVTLACVLMIVTVVAQILKVRAEQQIYIKAVAELDVHWRS